MEIRVKATETRNGKRKTGDKEKNTFPPIQAHQSSNIKHRTQGSTASNDKLIYHLTKRVMKKGQEK